MSDPTPQPASDLDRLHSVEEVTHRLASELASAKADHLRVERLLEGLAGRIEAGQLRQSDLADRIERLAAQLVALGRLDALDRRLEALQSNHEATDERLNRLTATRDLIGQLERRLGDQGETLTHQIEAQREQLLAELQRREHRRSEDFTKVNQEVQALAVRLGPIEQIPAAVTALDRRLGGLAPRFDLVDQRLADQAAETASFKAQHGAHEERLRSAQASAQAAVEELGAMIADLANRVGQQTGVMLEAKTLADELRRQDDERRGKFRTLSEAERLFEARVETTLVAAQDEVAARFEALAELRGREWKERRKELAEHEAAAREVVITHRAEAAEALKREVDALKVTLEVQAAEIAALRGVIATAADGWLGVSSELVAAVGGELPLAGEGDPVDQRRRDLAERVAAAKLVHPS